MGDSFTEAVQVDLKDTFWYKLELKLGKCPKFSEYEIEVLNFGVSGYGTAQELITLRQYVWQYSPDMVLLAFYQGNDVEDNEKKLGGYFPRPFFYLKDGQLVEDVSFRDSAYFAKSLSAWVQFKNYLINRVRLLQLLYYTKTVLEERQATQEPEHQVSGDNESEEGYKSSLYAEPKTSEWMDAWNVTESLIAQMDYEVKAKGSTFVLVTLSTSIQVHPDVSKRDHFKEKLGVSDLFYPDQRLASFAKGKNIHVLNLGQPMYDYVKENNTFLHGFPNTDMGTGHWNEAGHELAAELISTYICEDLGEAGRPQT